MIATPDQISTVAKHYVIACIWADAPEGTHPNATKSAIRHATAECAKFIEACGALFNQAMECDGYGSHPDARSPEAAFGHDFYLTRQGHGVGFWDRKELGTELGDALTAVCKQQGETYPEFYRGWLYLR